MSDNEFDQGDSGASKTKFVEAGRLKPGSLVMMKETFPCKVTAMSTAKPGKHGSAKAMVTAKDIFTDKQYDETFGTGDNIPAPVTKTLEYELLSLEGDQCCLMDSVGGLREDVDLPTGVAHLKDVVKNIKACLDEEKF